MADTVKEQWVYPPNWDGNAPTNRGWRRVTKKFSCVSDGTGETDVIKVNISDLRNVMGNEVVRTVVENIKFLQHGFDRIELNWDRAPENTIFILSEEQGDICFLKQGGLVDPGEPGDRTGDILLTSVGATTDAVYDITMTLKLKDK